MKSRESSAGVSIHPSTGTSPEKHRSKSSSNSSSFVKGKNASAGNSSLFQCGPLFLVPYGPNTSINLTRILQNKVKDAGGTIATTASEADIVVIDPFLSQSVVQKDFLRGEEYDRATKVSIDWLTRVINTGEWIDPHQDQRYTWRSHGSSSNTSATNSQGDADAVAATDEVGLSSSLPRTSGIKIDTGLASNEEDQSLDSPRQREYEATRQKLSDAGAESNPSKSSKLNENLIAEMSKMAEMYAAQGEKWRAKAYAQAAAILKTLDYEVTSSEQIKDRKGIGPRMAAHIDEILATGKYAKRVAFEHDPKAVALVKLTKIFGVGKAIALKLHRLGYPDIDSIRTGLERGDPALSFFNRNQRIGIRYYEDLEIRIKRLEVEAICDTIRNAAREVYPPHVANHLTIEAVGSYRRGKETCGDCDILMSLPTHPTQRVSLSPLVARLVSTGFIKETLSLPMTEASTEMDSFASRRREELVQKDSLVSSVSQRELESETFMGICLIPPGHKEFTGIHHRIDIKSYAFQASPFALLYFTGSALFSRNMRLYANQRGWKLTDRGLYPLLNEFFTSTDHGIKCKTEEEIFKALGLEYVEPKDRNYDEVATIVSDDDEMDDQPTHVIGKKSKSLKGSDVEEEKRIKVSREDEDEGQKRLNEARFEAWLKESGGATARRKSEDQSFGRTMDDLLSRDPSHIKREDEPYDSMLFGGSNASSSSASETINTKHSTPPPAATLPSNSSVVNNDPSKERTSSSSSIMYHRGAPETSTSSSSKTTQRTPRLDSILPSSSTSSSVPESTSTTVVPNESSKRSGKEEDDEEIDETRETQWMRLMHGPARRSKRGSMSDASSASSKSSWLSYKSGS